MRCIWIRAAAVSLVASSAPPLRSPRKSKVLSAADAQETMLGDGLQTNWTMKVQGRSRRSSLERTDLKHGEYEAFKIASFAVGLAISIGSAPSVRDSKLVEIRYRRKARRESLLREGANLEERATPHRTTLIEKQIAERKLQ